MGILRKGKEFQPGCKGIFVPRGIEGRVENVHEKNSHVDYRYGKKSQT